MSDEPSTNHTGEAPALAVIREEADNLHLFRGFGPFVVGVVLFVLMVALAPSVAPEQIVERPANSEDSSDSEGGVVTTSTRPPAASSSTTSTAAAP